MMSDLRQYLLEYEFFGSRGYNRYSVKRLRSETIIQINQETAFLDEISPTLIQRIWHIRNADTEIRYWTCKTCGKVQLVPFVSLAYGYKDEFLTYCSVRCQMKDPENHAKMRASYKEKTGCDHPTRNPDAWKRREENYVEKTGYKNHMENPEVMEKRKQLYFEKTGYETPTVNPEVIEKMKETAYSRTCEEKQKTEDRRKATCLERYGVDHQCKSSKVRDKITASFVKKYGVEHALQNASALDKYLKARYKRKNVIICGKEYSLQGFEPQALQYLVENKLVDIEKLVVGTNNGSRVRYSWDGKDRIYFPDFADLENSIYYEVKSGYTYKQSKERNIAKRDAVLALGAKYCVILVTDSRKDGVKCEMIWENHFE